MKIRTNIPARKEVDCPNCGSTCMGHLEVDEDYAHYAIETTVCNMDFCHVELCPSCPQFVCHECGLPHCLEHKVLYSGNEICPVCMSALAEVAA